MNYYVTFCCSTSLNMRQIVWRHCNWLITSKFLRGSSKCLLLALNRLNLGWKLFFSRNTWFIFAWANLDSELFFQSLKANGIKISFSWISHSYESYEMTHTFKNVCHIVILHVTLQYWWKHYNNNGTFFFNPKQQYRFGLKYIILNCTLSIEIPVCRALFEIRI